MTDTERPTYRYLVKFKNSPDAVPAVVVTCNQVLAPSLSSGWYGDKPDNKYLFHGEVNGKWTLLYAVDASKVASVRLIDNENNWIRPVFVD